MIRYFLVLAVTGASFLIADVVLGVIAAGEAPGPHAVAHALHLLFSLATVVVLLGIHSIVYTYFVATGKWAQEVVRVYQLPDGFNEQAKQNKRRAFRFIMGSMMTTAVAAWLGAAADTRPGLLELAPGGGHPGTGIQSRLLRRRVWRDRGPCPAPDGVEGSGRPDAPGALWACFGSQWSARKHCRSPVRSRP